MPDGFTLHPIGTLRTPWHEIDACPRNGRQPDPAPLCRAELLPAFIPGLLGLEGLSHLIVLYWMHQAKPSGLVFTPPFDSRERGVFATRSPRRPNPIGMSVVAFEGMLGPGVLKLRYLDCVDGTPLLDIKPYLVTTDCEPDASMGWLAGHATRNRNTQR
jgi:tRNA-Thr(GGU) m(6)t(6)A37 methyltransferase TsaA